MGKLLLFLVTAVLSITLSACEKSDFFDENTNPEIPERKLYGDDKQGVITKLYQVKMRRELLIPFSAYVLQVDNGDYLYLVRLRFNQDLSVGDVINYSVFSYCPNEIAKINDCYLGDGDDASANSDNGSIGYLFATDPIEAQIKNIFSMKIRYSISFLPVETLFMETTDGNLVFIKKSKVNVPLAAGDRIVYSKYTLYDELLTLKKL